MEKFKKIVSTVIEVMSYIVLGTCLWFFTYFQINLSEINNEYRIWALLLVTSGLLYFNYKSSDVLKEIVCTVGVIITTSILAREHHYGFNLRDTIISVAVTIVYLGITWIISLIAKREKNLFGKYTIALNLFTFMLLAVFLFVLNMNAVLAVAVSLAINYVVGYYIFRHNQKSGDVSLQ